MSRYNKRNSSFQNMIVEINQTWNCEICPASKLRKWACLHLKGFGKIIVHKYKIHNGTSYLWASLILIESSNSKKVKI